VKIVTVDEMIRIERAAYKKGAKEASFMVAAGRGIALKLKEYVQKHSLQKVVTFLCGKGNNSGDAYVAAELLRHSGFQTVVLQLTPIEQSSPLCRQHHEKYVQQGGYVISVASAADCSFASEGVIVDGLFGTGFRGKAEGHFAAVIEEANRSELPILSIDIPSGLQGSDGQVVGPAIRAAETIFLGLPKMGFFFDEGWNHIGRLSYVDFGLDEESLNQAQGEAILLNNNLVKGLLPSIQPNRHKYQAGVVAALAGSSEMPGAALLACRAAMRSGAGLVRLFHREGVEVGQVPEEVIRVPYRGAEEILEGLNGADGALVGPGLGRDDEMGRLLEEIIPKIEVPVVLDADALYWCAMRNLPFPKGAVLTPHLGEMRRLLHSEVSKVTKEFFVAVQQYSDEKGVCIVLKGGPSFIFYPQELPLVSTKGDPGMATAGSGDVLTGVVASLLAQGLHSRDAAALGTYLHGSAGEAAATEQGSRSMIASDIISHLPNAFRIANDSDF
jgi:NAD(P)H-hydrate epimerase